MNIKKKFIVAIASGIMLLSATPFVMAEPVTSDVGGQDAVQEAVQTEQQSSAVNTTTSTAELTNKKYLTKGGAAFWFVFTIVVNGVISFWIGNRFYQLSKKDNHISSEIRALRKDVEEKFVKSVGGFSEQEVDIENLNESLATDDEGIKPIVRQTVLREVSDEEEERFRRWEEAQSRPKSTREKKEKEHTEHKSAVKEELDDDFEEIKRIRRKNYQPEREEDAAEEDNMGETKAINLKGESVKNKAKEILGEMFPFKED